MNDRTMTKAATAALATPETEAAHTQARMVESLVLRGDLSGLGPVERAAYYTRVCDRLGLDPFSQPFEFLKLNGKEIMYAKARAGDQLAAIHKLNREIIDGPKLIDLGGTKLIYAVAKITHPNGRVETATATVPFIDPVNVLMKCETKAKRRGTLAILGLGMLDEAELDTIPDAVKGTAAQVDVALAPRRPAIDATPAPLALPADNGLSPSQASQPDAAPSLTDEQVAALESFYTRVAEIELPGESVAVWMKHRGALAQIPPRERENAWKALCSRTEEVGKMSNAKVWLKKAIAEEDARRAEAAKPDGDGDDDPKPRGGKRPARGAKSADAAGDVAPAANDGAVDAPGARSTSGHPMATRAERRAHLATLRRPEDVRTSWRHRAAMPPAGYMEDCADRVCALTPGFGVEDALAYLAAPAPAKVTHEPKTRAA